MCLEGEVEGGALVELLHVLVVLFRVHHVEGRRRRRRRWWRRRRRRSRVPGVARGRAHVYQVMAIGWVAPSNVGLLKSVGRVWAGWARWPRGHAAHVFGNYRVSFLFFHNTVRLFDFV
jgi:hypothetical protein